MIEGSSGRAPAPMDWALRLQPPDVERKYWQQAALGHLASMDALFGCSEALLLFAFLLMWLMRVGAVGAQLLC
jgi:hypothetical protein